MFGKQKLAALVAEFLGTGILTLVSLKVLYSLGVPFFVAMGVKSTRLQVYCTS
jgi:hypothetical protein